MEKNKPALAKELPHQEELRRFRAEAAKLLLGPDDPDTLKSMNNLSLSYEALGRHADALKLREETLALQKGKLGTDHPDTLTSKMNLANSYAAFGRHTEAVKLNEEILALMKAKLGPENRKTLGVMTNLALSYYHSGRMAEALALQEEALKLKQAKLSASDPYTAAAKCNLAWWLATAPDVKLRDPARAVELAAKAAQISPTTPECWCVLGSAHYRISKWKEAIAELEKAHSLRNLIDAGKGTIVFSDAANNGFFLAMAHWRQGNKDKAREWFVKAVQWMEKGITDYAETKRIRAEAAQLLGLPEPPSDLDVSKPEDKKSPSKK